MLVCFIERSLRVRWIKSITCSARHRSDSLTRGCRRFTPPTYSSRISPPARKLASPPTQKPSSAMPSYSSPPAPVGWFRPAAAGSGRVSPHALTICFLFSWIGSYQRRPDFLLWQTRSSPDVDSFRRPPELLLRRLQLLVVTYIVWPLLLLYLVGCCCSSIPRPCRLVFVVRSIISKLACLLHVRGSIYILD